MQFLSSSKILGVKNKEEQGKQWTGGGKEAVDVGVHVFVCFGYVTARICTKREFANGTYIESKGAMAKSILLAFSFFALLVTPTAFGQYSTSAIITPPAGNSPNKVVKTASAYFIYTCINDGWVRTKGYATLLDETTNKVVGTYTLKGTVGTWTLQNSAGDSAEGGSSTSSVTGQLVASSAKGVGSLPEELMEAASHLNSGEAAEVSYIQNYNIKGGLPPPKWKCSAHKSVTVPFWAEFCLWTQDPLPASVPGNLVTPGRVLEGFFGKGSITYKYNGGGWVDSGRVATLHTLPGTPSLGKYTSTNGHESWNIWNPNGVILYGIRNSPEVVVAPSGCPWSLSRVTSGSGPLMTIGEFTHVQTTSTRGGVAPPKSFDAKVADGATMTVPFSAIFWLILKT